MQTELQIRLLRLTTDGSINFKVLGNVGVSRFLNLTFTFLKLNVDVVIFLEHIQEVFELYQKHVFYFIFIEIFLWKYFSESVPNYESGNLTVLILNVSGHHDKTLISKKTNDKHK